jgi:cell division protein ZapA
MNQLLEVEVYGQRYVLRGEADEGYAGRLAQYVDGKIRELAAQSRSATPARLAVLAAINITHELFQLQKKQRVKDKAIEHKTRDLIESLEDQFGDLKLY